ncbi:MAG: hypothetical protein QY312_04470 [Candidatus Dojkabacteria bacterium]|nr:MAG: hypothetical protein QY312_04470 [Candidatus Dojkabacteria bacterium]
MKTISKRQSFLIEAFGWYGVVAIVSAYTLVSFELYKPFEILPVFLNISGSAGILLDAWKDRNWQPVAINTIWIAIAVLTFLGN